jgi:hypothetical protein
MLERKKFENASTKLGKPRTIFKSLLEDITR